MTMKTSTERRPPFKVSVVKNTAPDGRLCKVYEYDAAAEVLGCETNAYLTRGTVVEESFDSIGDFMVRREKLEPNEALMMGRPIYSPAKILTQKELRSIGPERRRDERIIARDRDHVSWSDRPSILMFDVDNPDAVPPELRDRVPTTPEGFRELILECIPGLRDVPMAWAPSSSSHIYLADRELRGLRGQRFYAVIESGLAIEQLKVALRNALALRGLVWFEVSNSGALLERYPFDFMVYQPERLDFAAGPECEPPLEWRPAPWRTWNEDGPYLRAADLPSLSEADRRQIDSIRRERRRAKAPDAREAKEQWTEETGRRIALNHKHLDHDQAVAVARHAVDRGVLLPDFILTDEGGQSVRVGDLLANPHENNGRRFHDPLEPDYRDDRRIAVFLVDDAGRCRIFSHAHGGQWWRCETKIIQVRLGLIDETVDEIRAALEQDPCDLYRHGDTIVHVDPAAAEIQTLEPDGLALRLQRKFDVIGRTKQGWVPKNISRRDLQALMSETASLPIPPLAVVTPGPFARADGGPVDVPGYDPVTEVLYLSSSESPPGVRRKLGLPESEDALRALLGPFSAFPFKSDLDRGVFLAAVLSAVTRLSLPTAPGYLITAPTPGSGKTTLAEAIGALQTGSRIACSTLPDSDEEIRKQVFAALRDGSTYLAYDNLERGSRLKSSVLAGLMTSPVVGQRVLGFSANERRPNRMTMVFTGNNILPEGDLVRRVLPIRLDPGLEHPERRTFDFDPVSRILSEFIRLRIAALEVLSGWQQDGARTPTDAMGFTEWNAVVRAAVLWAGDRLDVGLGFGDPADAIQEGYAEDPESQVLGHLLEALHTLFGDREFQLKDVADAITQAELDEWPDESEVSDRDEARAARKALAEGRRLAVPHGAAWEGTQVAFGRYLDKHKDHPVRGLKLVKGGMTAGSRRWRVCRVEANSAVA